MKLKLLESDFRDPHYGGTVRSRFLATPVEIERLYGLDGLTLDFGEYFGKYSDVSGLVEKDKLKITELNDTEIEVLLKYAGKILEGPNIFYYYESDEVFYRVYNAYLGERLLQILSDKQLDFLDRQLQLDEDAVKAFDEKTGRYYAYCYKGVMEDILTTTFIREWHEKIEKNESKIDEWKEEFYELVLTKINEEMEK